jgi:hypothetical protein
LLAFDHTRTGGDFGTEFGETGGALFPARCQGREEEFVGGEEADDGDGAGSEQLLAVFYVHC